MTQRVLIAGCGDIGGALGATLALEGHTVWGLRRRVEALPKTLRPLQADLAEPLPAELLSIPFDTVYYTAAASERSDAGYQEAYVQGVRHLINALQNNPAVKRLIFVSSTSVYAQTTGERVDEDSPTITHHLSCQRKQEAEALIHQSPWESTCLRFGGIYGPARTRLARRVLEGGAQLKSPASNGLPFYTNRIHRDDCVAALAFLLQVPSLPSLLLGVDDAPAPWNEVITWMADTCGLPPPSVVAPSPSATNKLCDNQRLKAQGFALQYPSWREGYGPILASLQKK